VVDPAADPAAADPVALQAMAADPAAADPVALQAMAADPAALQVTVADPVALQAMVADPVALQAMAADPAALQVTVADPVAANQTVVPSHQNPLKTPSTKADQVQQAVLTAPHRTQAAGLLGPAHQKKTRQATAARGLTMGARFARTVVLQTIYLRGALKHLGAQPPVRRPAPTVQPLNQAPHAGLALKGPHHSLRPHRAEPNPRIRRPLEGPAGNRLP
jgi:hypothetical protein